MYYYAVLHEKGYRQGPEDLLARFSTRPERDEWCIRLSCPPSGPVWEPVTLRSVKHRFNPEKFKDTSVRRTVKGMRTKSGRTVDCIPLKLHCRRA